MSLLKRIGRQLTTRSAVPHNRRARRNCRRRAAQGQPPEPHRPRAYYQPGLGALRSEDNGRRQCPLGSQDNMLDLKNRVQQRLIAELDPKLDLTKTDEVRRKVEDIFNQILETENIVLTRVERARLFEAVARRNPRLWSDRAAAEGQLHQRNHGQRPEAGLHRAPRSPGEDQCHSSRTTNT